jgi:ABC-type Na+ efflux pump permease subunit
MTVNQTNWRHSLRMIWAIARKDIVDAIQNKTVIGIMIGVGFMMLSSQALSLLVKSQGDPSAVAYDPGSSSVVRTLVRGRTIRLGIADSFDSMVSVVAQSVEPRLGIVLPQDFDSLAEGNEPVEVQGYVSHWVKSDQVADLVIYFEEHLSAAAGNAVRIQVADNQVYPNPDELGYSTMVSTGVVLGVMTIGLILVPILLIEEKETHTLEALMVSPVRTPHLMLGKLLAGLFYALISSVVIFIFSGYWIVHWWVVLLAVFLGALCAVVTGLLVGTIFDNITTVNLWIGMIIVFFLLPIFIWSSIAPKLPETIQTLAQGLPSLAMFKLVGLSLAETVTLNQVSPYVLVMAMFILLMVGLVAWRIRYLDR